MVGFIMRGKLLLGQKLRGCQLTRPPPERRHLSKLILPLFFANHIVVTRAMRRVGVKFHTFFFKFNPRRDCYMTPKPHHTIRGQTTCAPRGKILWVIPVRRTEKTAHI